MQSRVCRKKVLKPPRVLGLHSGKLFEVDESSEEPRPKLMSEPTMGHALCVCGVDALPVGVQKWAMRAGTTAALEVVRDNVVALRWAPLWL
eukprot:3730608-Amphidinium_carterae.2